MSSSYSLNQPLPQEIFQKPSAGIATYRNFPVFSWQWLWRRTALIGPLAAIVGTTPGILVAAIVHDWRLGALLSATGAFAYLTIVMAGPFLAGIARHARWRKPWESIAVMAAIVLGMGISFTAQRASDSYMFHRFLPAMIAMNKTAGRPSGPPPQPQLFKDMVLFYGAIELCLSFAMGGGFALRAYFTEQSRWGSHEKGRELHAMRLQRDESDRRLTVLQAQVEPHFLFNTLASVRSLIKPDPQRAEATIDALVDHLRATLPRLRSNERELSATLSHQVDICRSYLDVMKVRMGERLSYRIELPEQLRGLYFPPLILISLVENAIKHGVEPKPGPCTVVIEVAVREISGEQQLFTTVTDDGAGLRTELSDGLGLANIRAQLAARYGDRAALELCSGPTGGVRATLRLPREGAFA